MVVVQQHTLSGSVCKGRRVVSSVAGPPTGSSVSAVAMPVFSARKSKGCMCRALIDLCQYFCSGSMLAQAVWWYYVPCTAYLLYA